MSLFTTLSPLRSLSPSSSLTSLRHNRLPLIQQVRHLLQVPNQTPAQADKQQFLRIGRQTKIRRRLALGELLDPRHELLQGRAAGDDEIASSGILIIFRTGGIPIMRSRRDSFDKLVANIESGRGQEGVDELVEHLEIVLVVDLAAVRLDD